MKTDEQFLSLLKSRLEIDEGVSAAGMVRLQSAARRQWLWRRVKLWSGGVGMATAAILTVCCCWFGMVTAEPSTMEIIAFLEGAEKVAGIGTDSNADTDIETDEFIESMSEAISPEEYLLAWQDAPYQSAVNSRSVDNR